MADSTLITTEASLNRATIIQTSLAGSKLHLLQNITAIPSTNRANLLANEANFTGYPSGGYNLASWLGPGLNPSGGAVITSPTEQIATNAVPAVTNQLTGWWVETSGNQVMMVGVWNPARPAALPTDQFPFAVQDFEGLISTLPG